MKQNSYKLLFTALITGFTFAVSHAQQTFVKGYLVNDKGDTLRGEVKTNPKKEQDNYARVTFKDVSGTQKNYKPAKVKGYGFENNHFVSIGKEEEALFYKRLASGAIMFYKAAMEVVVMNSVKFEFEYFLFKDGDKKITTVKEGKFKKQLQEWMKDNANLADEYKEEKEFNETSATEVITKYNEWKKNN